MIWLWWGSAWELFLLRAHTQRGADQRRSFDGSSSQSHRNIDHRNHFVCIHTTLVGAKQRRLLFVRQRARLVLPLCPPDLWREACEHSGGFFLGRANAFTGANAQTVTFWRNTATFLMSVTSRMVHSVCTCVDVHIQYIPAKPVHVSPLAPRLCGSDLLVRWGSWHFDEQTTTEYPKIYFAVCADSACLVDHTRLEIEQLALCHLWQLEAHDAIRTVHKDDEATVHPSVVFLTPTVLFL